MHDSRLIETTNLSRLDIRSSPCGKYPPWSLPEFDRCDQHYPTMVTHQSGLFLNKISLSIVVIENLFQAFSHVLHACSALIEHNLHSTHQSIPSLSPSSFLLPTSPSRSPSALSQLPIALNLPILRSSSTMINNRSFQASDIHLFRTLHHLLRYSNDHLEQLISLNTIQLFLYLFLPFIQSYIQQNEKEFLAHNDLIEGWKCIWQPLLEYQQPNLRIFTALVKPNLASATLIESADSQESQSDTLLADSPSDPTADHSPTIAPLVHMSSICSVSDILPPINPG